MIAESSAFHTAIFDALCACLRLNKNSSEAIALIHEAYAEPENAIRPPRDRNVIYWAVLQDPAADPVSTEYESLSGGTGRNTCVVYTTLKYQLIIVCYGPASEEYAHRIRAMLYLDGYGFPRKILRDAGIYPIPYPPMPAIGHEEEGSLWRKRADLVIQIRVRGEMNSDSRGAITSPPGIIIRKGD